MHFFSYAHWLWQIKSNNHRNLLSLNVFIKYILYIWRIHFLKPQHIGLILLCATIVEFVGVKNNAMLKISTFSPIFWNFYAILLYFYVIIANIRATFLYDLKFCQSQFQHSTVTEIWLKLKCPHIPSNICLQQRKGYNLVSIYQLITLLTKKAEIDELLSKTHLG